MFLILYSLLKISGFWHYDIKQDKHKKEKTKTKQKVGRFDIGLALVQNGVIVHSGNELHLKEYEVHLSQHLIYWSACSLREKVIFSMHCISLKMVIQSFLDGRFVCSHFCVMAFLLAAKSTL